MPRMRIEIIDDETGEVIRALLFGPPEPDKDAAQLAQDVVDSLDIWGDFGLREAPGS